MSLIVLLSKQKVYFWSICLFIGLVFGLLVGGISIILISQFFFFGRVSGQTLSLPLGIVIGTWALVSFAYYKTFYPFLPCSITVEPRGLFVHNTTSEQLKLILQTAKLMRRYKARQGSGYLYSLGSVQELKTQDIPRGQRVFQQTYDLEHIIKYEHSLPNKITFSGIQVKGKDGKNIWVAFCDSDSIVFSGPRKPDRQGLILRPVWNHMKRLADRPSIE